MDVERVRFGEDSRRMPRRVFLTSLGVSLIVIVHEVRVPNEWVATHYLFSYQDGLRRRALVGSLLRLLLPGWEVSLIGVAALGMVALGVFALVASSLIATAAGREPPTIGVIAMGAVLIASAHTRTLALDTGRFDVLVITLLMVGAIASLRSLRLGIALVLPLGILGLLIHDISAVTLFPLLVLMPTLRLLASRHRPRGARAALVGSAIVLASAALLLLASPAVDEERIDEVRVLVTERSGFEPRQGSLGVQANSTRDNLETVRRALSRSGPIPVLSLILVTLPALALASRLVFSDRTRPRGLLRERDMQALVASRGLLLAAGSPLLLTIVGADYGRWSMAIVLNTAIAGLYVEGLRTRGILPASPVGLPERSRTWDSSSVVLLAIALAAPPPSRGGMAGAGFGFESVGFKLLGAAMRRALSTLTGG